MQSFKIETVSSDKSSISQAIEYIHSHLKEPLTLDDICNHLYISKYYFCTKFKKTMGMSTMQYILNTRIAFAKELLAGEMSIGNISQYCGFSGFAYFSRVFKEKTGLSPREYRQSVKKTNNTP